MGNAVRKGRRADPSKDEAIFDAASALFCERGYSASIDDIAAAAGVSKQTIYARYACKHDLLAAVVHRTAESLVSPLAVESARPEAALAEFGQRFVEVIFDTQRIAMQRLIIAESPQFPELAERYYESGPKFVIDTLAAYIARAAASGRLKVDDAAAAASQFLGLIISTDHMAALMGLSGPREAEARRARVRAAVDAFLRLYRAS